MQKNKTLEMGADGLENPFARGGIQRSPPRKVETDAVKVACEDGKGSTPTGSTQDIAVAGPQLLKAVGRQRDTLPRVVALSEQLDAIIEFAKSRSNTTKYLKQALYMLRSSVDAAKKEHAELEMKAAAAEKEETKVTELATKSVQTDASTFAAVCAAGPAAKRTRQSPGETAPGGTKKRLIANSPQTGVGVAQATPTVAAKEQKAPGNPWVTVPGRSRNQKVVAKKPHPVTNPATKKVKNKGDALILKTEESKYSEVLKAMRGDAKLKDLGADVRSIRRSRKGEMIVELRKEARNKGPAYRALAQEALGDRVQVRALTSQVTLQLKYLDEVTEACEVVDALKEQCEVVVAPEAVRLRKGPVGTQTATVRLPSVDANQALKVARLKMGWSMCPLSINQPPEVCFRCFEQGHKSFSCKGPDRSSLCRRCGAAGHKSKDCGEPPKCLACAGKRDAKHIMGGPRCTAGKPTSKPRA